MLYVLSFANYTLCFNVCCIHYHHYEYHSQGFPRAYYWCYGELLPNCQLQLLFHDILWLWQAAECILRTSNKTSHSPVQTCYLLKCYVLNMHHLTFPTASSIVRECGEEATWGRLSHEVALLTLREKIVDLQPRYSEPREFILRLCPENSNHFMFMFRLYFHPIVKHFTHKHHSVFCSIGLSRYTFCPFNPIDNDPLL